MSEHWKDAGLLLVGHGSSTRPAAGDAVRRVAAALRAKSLFADVQAAFWREDPKVSLDLIATPDLYIVPLFAGHGKHTDQLIPQALGLTGKLTHCDGRTIRYCPPLGTHPAIPQLLGRRAAELCHRENVNPAKTTLLLIAHGSSTGGASQTPDMVAHALRAMNIFAEVVVAYIEQAPAVHDWPNLVHTAMVIAVPLLISDGMHANDDLPPLFGLDKSTGGPAKIHGHRVWLMGGIGHDGELEQMTLDLVRAVGDKAP